MNDIGFARERAEFGSSVDTARKAPDDVSRIERGPTDRRRGVHGASDHNPNPQARPRVSVELPD